MSANRKSGSWYEIDLVAPLLAFFRAFFHYLPRIFVRPHPDEFCMPEPISRRPLHEFDLSNSFGPQPNDTCPAQSGPPSFLSVKWTIP
jgi:hypothetical protein